MTRRWLRPLALLGMAGALLGACSRAKVDVQSGAREFGGTPRRAGFDTVLVFLPNTPRVRPVWTSLTDELSEEFDVEAVEITASSGPDVVAAAIARHSPRCVVLLDNTTTALYARYQASAGPGGYPPAVILLTSFVDLYSEVEDAVGIAYEVPLVTSASNLRTFISRPIERVGVVHRSAFAGHVKHQAALARVEKLELVAAAVPDDATPRELASALSSLLGSNVDALWVLNDNALLTPEHIRLGWLPLLAKDAVPTIVGIPSLVTRDVAFGTFAVVPDLSALGVQAANVIYDLKDNDFVLDAGRIDQPLSVETVIDVERARVDFGFKEEMREEAGAVSR
ncbi:MAG TPA: hypothetical protein VFZ53_24245 [Polyangiaceae bacterium]